MGEPISKNTSSIDNIILALNVVEEIGQRIDTNLQSGNYATAMLLADSYNQLFNNNYNNSNNIDMTNHYGFSDNNVSPVSNQIYDSGINRLTYALLNKQMSEYSNNGANGPSMEYMTKPKAGTKTTPEGVSYTTMEKDKKPISQYKTIN